MGKGRGNVEVARGGPVAQPLSPKDEDLVSGDSRSGSAYRLSEDSGAVEPRPDPVPDQSPFELTDGGHDMEDEFPCWRGGIDVLLDRDEGHPAAAELLEGFNELLDGTGGLVEALNDHRGKSAPRGVRHESPEVRAVFPCPKGHIRVRRHQRPALPSSKLLDPLELDVEVLPACGDPGVGRGVHMPSAPTLTADAQPRSVRTQAAITKAGGFSFTWLGQQLIPCAKTTEQHRAPMATARRETAGQVRVFLTMLPDSVGWCLT